MYNNGLSNRSRLEDDFNIRKSKNEETELICSSVSDYKKLTLRRKYRRITIQYAVLLTAIFFLELIVLVITGFYNPVVIGFVIFTGVGALVSLIDLFVIKTATKNLDTYIKNLSVEDLVRIERHTGNLDIFTQLIFLEKEMIFAQRSLVKIFAYSEIKSISDDGALIELSDINRKVIGKVPRSGTDVVGTKEKMATIDKLQLMNPEISKEQ